MFDGLALLGLIGAAKQIFKEATEKTMPAGTRFDRELYDADDKAGVSYEERCKRMAKGYYHTTEPMKMFDLMKYREDVLAGATPDELESNRLAGKYGAVKPMGYDFNANFSLKDLPSDYILDVERYEYARRKYPNWFSVNASIPRGYDYRIDKSVYRQYM